MTPEQRAEARQLVDAATPGPWTLDGTDHEPNYYESECRSPTTGIIQSWDYEGYSSGIYVRHQDAAFIAASRTLVPQLLDALDAAERERDEARSIKAETLAAARSVVYWQDALKAMEVERDAARAQVAALVEALRTYANPTIAEEVIKAAGVEP